MNFRTKLDIALRAISEGLNDGQIWLPYISHNGADIILQRATVRRLVYRHGDRYLAKDFGDKRPLPGKFFGFAAVTAGEEAPTVVRLDAAALGEKLAPLAGTEDDGMAVVGAVADHPGEAEAVRALDKLSMPEETAICQEIGFYYSDDNPTPWPADEPQPYDDGYGELEPDDDWWRR